MENFLDLFYLLSIGRLPLSAVDPAQLPNMLTPVYRAFEYVLSKPHVLPLNVREVEKVARTRFHAKADAVELFGQLHHYRPAASTIESVQQSLLLRKIQETVSAQLATGKYNLTEISQYTSAVVSFGAASLVRPVAAPTSLSEVGQVKYLTGIGPLDAVLHGVHDELVIVCARPKNGKSNFLVNLVCLSPKKSFLYVTVADYGYAELCQVMYECDPAVTKRKNVHIADFTMFGATVVDVESVIREVVPDVVIVDRAEELAPITKAREQRWEVKAIFKTLRQLAKKYKVPLFVDAQQSEAGAQHMKQTGEVSPDFMAEDKTGRLATLDLFIGLQRRAGKVKLSVHGRRKSLPAQVEVRTSPVGRFLV